MKENKLDYTPEPMDLSSVDLPESLIQLSERIAENVHEVWAKARMDEGWTYGGKRDDIHKKTLVWCLMMSCRKKKKSTIGIRL